MRSVVRLPYLLGVGAGRARHELQVFVFVELFLQDKGAARNCWVRNQHAAAISSSVPRSSSIRIIRQAYKLNLCWVPEMNVEQIDE